MKPIQHAVVSLLVIAAFAGLSCAWVELNEGADRVGVLTEEAAQGCKRLGKTTANTTDSVGFIPRGKARIKTELRNIARNSAVRMGGDAIAPLGPISDGEQEFGIYRCAPEAPEGGAAPGAPATGG